MPKKEPFCPGSESSGEDPLLGRQGAALPLVPLQGCAEACSCLEPLVERRDEEQQNPWETGVTEIRSDPAETQLLVLGRGVLHRAVGTAVPVPALVPWRLGCVQHPALSLPLPGLQSRSVHVWARCGAGRGLSRGQRVVRVVAEPSQVSTGPLGLLLPST